MRKLIVTFGLAAALAVAFVSGAQGAARAAKAPCGNPPYSPDCITPKVKYTPPSPECRNAGPAYKLPSLTFLANAGIHEIDISTTKPIKTLIFKGFGPTRYVVSGVTVPTTGLAAGPHQVTITVKDSTSSYHHRSDTLTKTLRFTICAAKPVFTG